MISELLDLCDISMSTWCFIYHILHNKHMLMEIGGLISFKHDQVPIRSHFMLVASCMYAAIRKKVTNEITHFSYS